MAFSSISVILLWYFLTGSVRGALVELGDDDFEAKIPQVDTALVMFMAPWCGHCKALHPQIKGAAEILAKSSLPIAVYQVDCTERGQQTCDKLSITGYPTLKLYQKGKFLKDYDGERNRDAIVSYMKLHGKPCPVVVNTKKDLDDLYADDNAFVAFFNDKSSPTLKTLITSIATEMRGATRIGISESPELVKKFSPNNRLVYFQDNRLRSQFEPSEIIYEGKESKSDIEKWILKVKHGLLGWRRPENSKEFHLPLVVAYFDVEMVRRPKVVSYWRNRVLKTAVKYKNNFNFAFSSKFDFAVDFRDFGWMFLPEEDGPFVLLRTPDHKFKMTENFTVENFDDFLRKVTANELAPFVKSEKPPKTNDGPVRDVVLSTFNDMVVNSRNDTMLLLYSSQLRNGVPLSTWTDLGKAMEGEEVDVLKMNMAYNDAPKGYHFIGSSTIFWVSSNSKSVPIRYNGGLTLKDFIDYIAKTSTKELKSRHRSGNKKTSDEL